MQDRRGNPPEDDKFNYEPHHIDPPPREQLETLWRDRDRRLWWRAAVVTQLKLYGLVISIATGLGVLLSTLVSLWPWKMR